MTHRLASIAAPIAASICLLLAGTTGASAQIQCWMANSPGPPVVHDAHIFCGEIRQRANGTFYATGFHSRPGGINPVTAPARRSSATGRSGPPQPERRLASIGSPTSPSRRAA